MTAAPMSAARPAAFPHHAGSKAKYIAGQFLQQYYSVLQFRSKLLGRFYQDDSDLTIAGLPGCSDDEPPVHGSEAIGARAAEIFLNAKLLKEGEDSAGYVFDAQEVATDPSKASSILLHACGEMDIGGEVYRFFQTFFLAPQTEPAGFYVQHDVLRFVKEEKAIAAAAPTALPAARPRGPAENGYTSMAPGYHAGHQSEAHLSQPMQAVYHPPPSAPLHPNSQPPYSMDPLKATLPPGMPPAAVSAPAGVPHQQPRNTPTHPPQHPPHAHIPIHHNVHPAPVPSHAPPPAQSAPVHPVHPTHIPPPTIPPPPQPTAPAASAPADTIPAPPTALPEPVPAKPAAPSTQPAPAPEPVPPVPTPAPAPAPAPAPTAPTAPLPEFEPTPAAAASSDHNPQEEQPPQNLSYAERLRRSVQQPKSTPPPAAAPPTPVAAAKPTAPPSKPPAAPAPAPAPAPAAAPAIPAPQMTEDAASGAGSDDLDETASIHAESNSSVFVKNVPEATREELLQAVSQCGNVKGGINGVNIFMGKSMLRYAYIDFETPAGAEAAIAAELEVKGNKLQFELKRGGGGGRGRGYRGMSGRGNRSYGGRGGDDSRRGYEGRGDRPRIPNGSYKGRGGPRPEGGERASRGEGYEGGRGGRGGRGRSDRQEYRGGRGGPRSDAPRGEPRPAPAAKASE